MKIRAYHIDAFAGHVFSGNPAVVCPLDHWLNDEQLQLIAAENNLPATAFFVEAGDVFELRWFTPVVELDLCGHGTVAAASVIFDDMASSKPVLTFKTKSGDLTVAKDGPLICMDLPAYAPVICAPRPQPLIQALGKEPAELLRSRHYLAVYDHEEDIQVIAPNMDQLKQIECLSVIITAKGAECDFVYRNFAPRVGIPEDAATGSANCTLAPYWSKHLGQRKLHAIQLSLRRG